MVYPRVTTRIFKPVCTHLLIYIFSILWACLLLLQQLILRDFFSTISVITIQKNTTVKPPIFFVNLDKGPSIKNKNFLGICRRIIVKNCRHGEKGSQTIGNSTDVVYGWSFSEKSKIQCSAKTFYDDSIPNLPLIFLPRIFYTLNKQSSICDFQVYW